MFLKLQRMDLSFFIQLSVLWMQYFSSALFTALSNGKASATISFPADVWIYYGVFLLALPRFLEVTGVWLAVPLAELFTLMLTVYQQ